MQTLQSFWLRHGCILAQPYHTEVGAGTSNPATFLRVLGPEPWWVGYVEPSKRPTDGRYGENPNRLQAYHQYQVILKPSPPNVQDLYLQSLEALGLDLTKHDFRFVEDNWQSPSLGAWGLGWEAWLDGMEILQFTYFQECGGAKLDVRACELTYGLERIAMYIQGKESVYDLEWAPRGVTYRDIFFDSEVEYCKYNFEHADVEKLLHVFGEWEAEGKRLLEVGLILPAYDHCLRLSHLFNVLDARGAFSVAERGRFLLRCRAIAERCAKGFLAQRAEAGFPMLRLPQPVDYTVTAPPASALSDYAEKETLLIEIGVEELPHGDLQDLSAQLPGLVKDLFGQFGVTCDGDPTIWLTPRRIAICAKDVPARQQDVEKEARGPKRGSAQSSDGAWTVAAERFAAGNGVTVNDIYFREQGNAEYCFAKSLQKGKHLGDVLSDLVTQLLKGIRFGKSMGWEDTTVTFSRPVRWIVALHGGVVAPVAWKLRDASELGAERYLYSDRVSYGHRRLAPGAISLASASDYLAALRKHYVLADPAERMALLRERVQAICAANKVHPEDDAELFDEIADLTEWPEPVLCQIPEEFLDLPEDILITPMKTHQRYIPLRNADGSLCKFFLAVANGDHSAEGQAVIRTGNERVLNARLRDAKYFWDTDTKTPLSGFAGKLSNVLFHQKLGTVADKIARIRALYAGVKSALPAVDAKKIDQVFTLMKADLTTQMVFEFDSLEGVVGMLYARREGIADEIAQAILEHRLPRRAGDRLPSGTLGIIAGILDRFDSLAGYFGIGMKVKGTSDPFGLRRNALALLSIMRSADLDLDIEVFAKAALAGFGALVTDPAQALRDILDFFNDRLAVMLKDEGHPYDRVAAALAVHGRRPAQLRLCLAALSALDDAKLQDLAEQAKRMQRIVKEPADKVDSALLDANERDFHALCDGPAKRVKKHVAEKAFDAALSEVLGWVSVISAYFESVLVNDSNDAKRRNRHALLQSVLRSMQTVADFTQIEKKEVATPV
ncbi:MAG: glycine--tRNA ligase subunit beta [Candidatus Hydrogenedentes bacterium]|nr:glycine--tRNA ligase subunit beta [Candidatus Hydrogenedentota bacterium]